MSWSRSSRRVLLALLALALVVAPPAAAISTSADAPSEAKVGEQITVTVELNDLYTDAPNTWTLSARTNLTNVTWTVRRIGVDGNQIAERSYDGQSIETKTPISSDENIDTVNVTIRGTVPEISSFTFEPKEEFILARFERTREGGNTQQIKTWRTHHFTEKSKEARNQLVDAEAAIAEVGGQDDAEQQLERAISAYENGNFENAISLAKDAQRTAEQSQEKQGRNRMLLFGGIGLVALVVIVGGVYVYRSRQDSYDKLR